MPKRLPPRTKSGQFKKRKKPAAKPRRKNTKRKANPMAKTAVVNRRKGRKRKAPKRYGSAKRKRRRNPSAAAKPSPYSSGGYYRRPNPNMFDMDTYTRTMPAATAGVWFARWAVKMAGPFEPDAQGVPVPVIKHAIAIIAATEFGGKLVGQLLGGRRHRRGLADPRDHLFEVPFSRRPRERPADAFLRHRRLDRVSERALGRLHTYTDPAGNKYVRSGSGGALAGQEGWEFGQPDEVPSDAEPGDIVQTPSGDIFEVMADGNMASRPDLTQQLAVPTNELPMAGFEQASPLGAFEQASPLGSDSRGRGDTSNSFGYAA